MTIELEDENMSPQEIDRRLWSLLMLTGLIAITLAILTVFAVDLSGRVDRLERQEHTVTSPRNSP